MTTDEKRFFRREWINIYIQDFARFQRTPYFARCAWFVRFMELREYNQNLNIYSKGE